MGIPEHITCLRETRAQVMKQVRSRHGKMDFFKIGKGIQQGCILSPCLFHSYAEYIMQMLDWMNYKLEYRLLGEISTTSDMQMTTLMAERKEELKSLLMKMKEESEKADLKLNLQNTKIMASGPITAWQIDGETQKQ